MSRVVALVAVGAIVFLCLPDAENVAENTPRTDIGHSSTQP